MMPWKLVFCDLGWFACRVADPEYPLSGIRLEDMPDPPEPGRVPQGVDHVHIVQKLSGERDAREEEKWRALLWGTARCNHGRLPGDRCRSCRGYVPSLEGTRIGTTADRRAIYIPSREEMQDILKWAG